MITSLPNIVLIVSDDQGWADIGYHNSFMVTPTLDSLAENGMILNMSYVQPTCSPSRTALMTGFYPYRAGVVTPADVDEEKCAPLSLKLLPEYLQDQGYITHMLGKWHLGYCHWNCTPTYRGFNSFYGFYYGFEGYYDHSQGGSYDFNDGVSVDLSINGTYVLHPMTSRAVEIIENHAANNADDPMFLYYAYPNAHAPLEVPSEYEALCSSITDTTRKTYCGMLAAMDASIANVTAALDSTGLRDNTLIIFTSDNGGTTAGGGAGYNYPLRGRKSMMFEGGIRVPAFVNGPMVTKTGENNGLFHITDWFSTIMSFAGKSPNTATSGYYGDIDGIDQYSMITTGGPSARTEVVHGVGEESCVMKQGVKLIQWLSDRPGEYVEPPEYSQKKRDVGERVIRQPAAREVISSLFDIGVDPTESNDLINDTNYAAILADLTQKITDYKALSTLDTALVANGGSKTDTNGAKVPGWCDLE